mmetsp:Transcript_21283/g.43183  ORF Transcript_21283/g.43183 Transcript_21283/m.43183 type:complete len:219 (+) Transcript_21283:599-1255(+)
MRHVQTPRAASHARATAASTATGSTAVWTTKSAQHRTTVWEMRPASTQSGPSSAHARQHSMAPTRRICVLHAPRTPRHQQRIQQPRWIACAWMGTRVRPGKGLAPTLTNASLGTIRARWMEGRARTRRDLSRAAAMLTTMATASRAQPVWPTPQRPPVARARMTASASRGSRESTPHVKGLFAWSQLDCRAKSRESSSTWLGGWSDCTQALVGTMRAA